MPYLSALEVVIIKIVIIIITAFVHVQRNKVRRYRLRLSEQMGLEVSFEGATVRQDLMSDGSELQVCGAATEKDLRTFSSGASDDRRGRTGTALWIRSFKYAGVEEDIVLNVSAAIL